nr:uncharacterized protein LOC109147379 [Ipomoea batatas]
MGDPREHLVSYQAKMQVLGVEDPLMCKAFLPILKGLAQKWFLALSSRSIKSFNDLADQFLTHYAVNIKPQRNLTYLSRVHQAEGESLKTYLARWQKEIQTIEGLDEQVAITFFMESLRAGKLFIDLHNDQPKTYVEAIQRASRQANTRKRSRSGGSPSLHLQTPNTIATSSNSITGLHSSPLQPTPLAAGLLSSLHVRCTPLPSISAPPAPSPSISVPPSNPVASLSSMTPPAPSPSICHRRHPCCRPASPPTSFCRCCHPIGIQAVAREAYSSAVLGENSRMHYNSSIRIDFLFCGCKNTSVVPPETSGTKKRQRFPDLKECLLKCCLSSQEAVSSDELLEDCEAFEVCPETVPDTFDKNVVAEMDAQVSYTFHSER